MARKRGSAPTNLLIGLVGYMRGARSYTDADVDAIIAAVRQLPPGYLFSQRPTEDGAGYVPVKVTRRQELSYRLEWAAVEFAHEAAWQSRLSPSQLAKQMTMVETAGRRLSQALANSAIARDDGKLLNTETRRALQEEFKGWAEANEGYPFVFPDIAPMKFEKQGYSGIDYAPAAALQRCIAAVDMLTKLAGRAAQQARLSVRAGRLGSDSRNKGDVALRQFIGALSNIYRDLFEKDPGRSHSRRGGDAGGPFIRFVQAALEPLGIVTSGNAIASRLPRKQHIVKSASKKT